MKKNKLRFLILLSLLENNILPTLAFDVFDGVGSTKRSAISKLVQEGYIKTKKEKHNNKWQKNSIFL